jgi:hypothetical protein
MIEQDTGSSCNNRGSNRGSSIFLFTLGEGGEVATNAIRVNVAAYFDFLLLRVSQQKDRSKRNKNKNQSSQIAKIGALTE